jgi:hypothetical protein
MTRKCRNSWSFLHFPELQIFHGWPTDHFSSQNKWLAEFRNSCISGITRKCRNSWSFLHFPELQIFHGWPTDHFSSRNKWLAEFRNSCISGITSKCRNSCSCLHFPELQISHFLALTLRHTFTPTHTLTPHPHGDLQAGIAAIPGHSI